MIPVLRLKFGTWAEDTYHYFYTINKCCHINKQHLPYLRSACWNVGASSQPSSIPNPSPSVPVKSTSEDDSLLDAALIARQQFFRDSRSANKIKMNSTNHSDEAEKRHKPAIENNQQLPL